MYKFLPPFLSFEPGGPAPAFDPDCSKCWCVPGPSRPWFYFSHLLSARPALRNSLEVTPTSRPFPFDCTTHVRGFPPWWWACFASFLCSSPPQNPPPPLSGPWRPVHKIFFISVEPLHLSLDKNGCFTRVIPTWTGFHFQENIDGVMFVNPPSPLTHLWRLLQDRFPCAEFEVL